MKLLPAILLILLFLLTACVGGHPVPAARAATPEDVALRAVPQLSNPAPDKIALHGTHVTPYGTAVFFTTDHTAHPESSTFGFVLAVQQGGNWVTRDVIWDILGARLDVPKYVFVTGTVHDFGGRRVGSTWGRALKPDVAAVEVMFNDGQVRRDTLTPEGMFIVMADNTFTYCIVKVLDAHDHVLETIHTQAANGCSKE